jgi:hypothetical protein
VRARVPHLAASRFLAPLPTIERIPIRSQRIRATIPKNRETSTCGSPATVGPIAWDLGPASYWWRNIPFRETYAAKLHYLNATVNEGTTLLGTLLCIYLLLDGPAGLVEAGVGNHGIAANPGGCVR